jgi:hypothetical protein
LFDDDTTTPDATLIAPPALVAQSLSLSTVSKPLTVTDALKLTPLRACTSSADAMLDAVDDTDPNATDAVDDPVATTCTSDAPPA